MCAGFMESTEPHACLAAALENNECEEEGNAGCWKEGNFSACADTFRGYRCVCPAGFSGDGVGAATGCVDVDECAPADPPTNTCEQKCINTMGGHHCACNDGFRPVGATSCFMIDECTESSNNEGCQQLCIPHAGGHTCMCIEGYELGLDGKSCAVTAQAQEAMAAAAPRGGGGTGVGGVLGITLLVLSGVGLLGFVAYRWKIKNHIDSEVRAIMATYLPLDDERAYGGSGGGASGGGGVDVDVGGGTGGGMSGGMGGGSSVKMVPMMRAGGSGDDGF